jgi:hypothetical protein
MRIIIRGNLNNFSIDSFLRMFIKFLARKLKLWLGRNKQKIRWFETRFMFLSESFRQKKYENRIFDGHHCWMTHIHSKCQKSQPNESHKFQKHTKTLAGRSYCTSDHVHVDTGAISQRAHKPHKSSFSNWLFIVFEKYKEMFLIKFYSRYSSEACILRLITLKYCLQTVKNITEEIILILLCKKKMLNDVKCDVNKIFIFVGFNQICVD